jgi:hypothetical protein
MAVRLSALTPHPQEDSWHSILLEVESTPGAIMQLEGSGQLKNPITSSGIEPTTFRLVAQCLNQLCYCVLLSLQQYKTKTNKHCKKHKIISDFQANPLS